MKRLDGSKFGEGVGGPVQSTDDPNDPSYDPAARETGTDRKIRTLMEPANVARLTKWDLEFLTNVYGADRLTQKQHKRVSAIHKRVMGGSPDEPKAV